MNKLDLFEDNRKCCGCEICAFSCRTGAISIIEDDEGFRYPFIDEDMCISCRQCISSCPVKNVNRIHSEWIESYSGWSNSEEVRVSSSSGGFAAEISHKIIQLNGVVYGVSYSSNFDDAIYLRCECLSELHKLKGSKYIQSRKGKVYQEIQNDLKNNRCVLFIGTPCDCAAVHIKFGKYENLYIISVICHGPTSHLVQKEFKNEIETINNSKLQSFNIRYKRNKQWKPYYINGTFVNGAQYLKPFSFSEYDNAFRHFKRPSCTSCVFKKDKFASDLVIGDYHSAKKNTSEYNFNGVSTILVTSNRGFELLKLVKDSFYIIDADLKRSTEQLALHSSYKLSPVRNQFAYLIKHKGLKAAANIPYIKFDNVMNSLRKFVLATGSKVKHKLLHIP